MKEAFKLVDVKYATGMDSIDKEHFIIMYHLLQIRDSANKHNLKPSLLEKLRRHFDHEEAIMELTNYTLVDLHKSVHKEYLIRFDAALTPGSGFSIDDLITDTLNHFIWHDRLLVEFLKDHNLIDCAQGISQKRASLQEQRRDLH